jgi:hypothetical protein
MLEFKLELQGKCIEEDFYKSSRKQEEIKDEK